MTPEQEEQVRRALAALRDGEPAPGDGPDRAGAGTMPPHVAARLDGVLQDLVAERATPGRDSASVLPDAAAAPAPPRPDAAVPAPARPDELAHRRRGRLQKAGLAAAAACVAALVGTAVSTGDLGAGGSSSTSASSDSGGQEAASARDGSADEAPTSRQPGPSPSGDTASRRLSGAPPAQLRTATLTQDVQRLVDSGSTRPVSPQALRAVCDAPVLRPGEQLLAVRLDGRRASLVLGPPDSGRRSAQVFGCRDTDAPLASVAVRTPAR